MALVDFEERNIHKLKALELTQLVDIFAPPYNLERAEVFLV